MQYVDIKEKILKLLGMEADEQGLVEFAFDDAKETALNYCHLDEVPSGLENTILRMTMDIFRNEELGSSEVPGAVASVALGDTATSFGKTPDEFRSGLLKDYKTQLNRYRRLA